MSGLAKKVVRSLEGTPRHLNVYPLAHFGLEGLGKDQERLQSRPWTHRRRGGYILPQKRMQQCTVRRKRYINYFSLDTHLPACNETNMLGKSRPRKLFGHFCSSFPPSSTAYALILSLEFRELPGRKFRHSFSGKPAVATPRLDVHFLFRLSEIIITSPPLPLSCTTETGESGTDRRF